MSDKVPIGKCEDHGIVYGDNVNYNFPNPSTCGHCGENLREFKLVPEEEIEKHEQETS